MAHGNLKLQHWISEQEVIRKQNILLPGGKAFILLSALLFSLDIEKPWVFGQLGFNWFCSLWVKVSCHSLVKNQSSLHKDEKKYHENFASLEISQVSNFQSGILCRLHLQDMHFSIKSYYFYLLEKLALQLRLANIVAISQVNILGRSDGASIDNIEARVGLEVPTSTDLVVRQRAVCH